MARRKDRASAGTFPGYTTLGEIGSGAFASVYRAVEQSTGRQVAIKALRVEDLPPSIVESFAREISALGLVSGHPNIVTLYHTLQTTDDRAALVLELCMESFSQRVRHKGPLTAREAMSVGVKIAGALETAHEAGFLHRDVKPQNVLLTSFGEPVISDFGVAGLRAQAQNSEAVFGFTTLHAPPEMLEGGSLSPATDVYSLASSLYQMLSGRPPFFSSEGEAPAAVMLRILSKPAPPLRDVTLPVGLSALLESALAKDPKDRPQTAAGFAEKLRDLEYQEGWESTSYVVWRPHEEQAHPGGVDANLDEQLAGANDRTPRVVSPLELLGAPEKDAGPGEAMSHGGSRSNLILPGAKNLVGGEASAESSEANLPWARPPASARSTESGSQPSAPDKPTRSPRFVAPPPVTPALSGEVAPEDSNDGAFGDQPLSDEPGVPEPASLPTDSVVPRYEATPDRWAYSSDDPLESTRLPRLHEAPAAYPQQQRAPRGAEPQGEAKKSRLRRRSRPKK